MTNREKRAKAARERRFLERTLASPTGRAPDVPQMRFSFPELERPKHTGKLTNYIVQARFGSRAEARAFVAAAAGLGYDARIEHADFAEIEARAMVHLAEIVNDCPLWANTAPITVTHLK